MTYYNRPSYASSVKLDQEVTEIDFMEILTPLSYTVAAIYVSVGTYLTLTYGRTVRAAGQILQILGAATFLRTLSNPYYHDNSAGKGF